MSTEPTRTFEDLEVWKSARDLRLFVSRHVAPILKESREFTLLDQIKRSSRSVGNNIAEGHGRFHFRDNYRFCSNARGSLNETLDHLIICKEDGLISEEVHMKGRARFETCLRLLNGYMAWLKRSANADGPTRAPK